MDKKQNQFIVHGESSMDAHRGIETFFMKNIASGTAAVTTPEDRDRLPKICFPSTVLI